MTGVGREEGEWGQGRGGWGGGGVGVGGSQNSQGEEAK